LPVLRLINVLVERELVKITPSSSSSAMISSENTEPASVYCQVLKVNAPCVEVGVHPSHLIVGTLAMQLLQQEFIALLGGSIGPGYGKSQITSPHLNL
jgi:hypothetical protein